MFISFKSFLPSFILVFIQLAIPSCLFAQGKFEVVVGMTKEPYVMEKDLSGFEIEVIRNTLALMDKSAEFVFIPYGHSLKVLEVGEIDAVMSVSDAIYQDISRLSDVYITYRDVAISLKNRNLSINDISDLANYSVVSFQQASDLFGSRFAEAVKASPLYMETEKQATHPKMLLTGKVDVVVIDLNIFNYHVKDQGLTSLEDGVTIHDIFPPTTLRMAFKNKADIPAFNQAYKQFIGTNSYQQLVKKYGF